MILLLPLLLSLQTLAGPTFWYQLKNRPSPSQRQEKTQFFEVNLYEKNAPADPLVQAFRGQGKEVICYFSAGTSEDWRPDYKRISKHLKGNAVSGGISSGQTWGGNNEPERWLNIRDKKVVWSLMAARIVQAKKMGCTGVDADNVDAYSSGHKTGFGINRSDTKSYLQFLSETAHRAGLKIGLKNSDEIAGSVAGLFDFVVAEECFERNECHKYKSFLPNKPVYVLEYRKFNYRLCEQALKEGYSLTFATRSLNGAGESCSPESLQKHQSEKRKR